MDVVKSHSDRVYDFTALFRAVKLIGLYIGLLLHGSLTFTAGPGSP